MSQKVATVIYSNVTDDMSRVYRALGTAAEFSEAGDDVAIVFDGSGVESLAALSATDHPLHGLLEGLREEVLGACGFCVKSHGVTDAVAEGGWQLLEDHKGHASVRDLVVDGRQVITF
jgi:intracellular sulfur oxidation DsrE/DsrF family protein